HAVREWNHQPTSGPEADDSRLYRGTARLRTDRRRASLAAGMVRLAHGAGTLEPERTGHAIPHVSSSIPGGTRTPRLASPQLPLIGDGTLPVHQRFARWHTDLQQLERGLVGF